MYAIRSYYDNTSYIAGKVLDVSPFTRSPQSGGSVNDVVEASKTIVFSTPFAVEMASYTAGVANRFTGAVVRYYSNGGTYETASTWDRDSKGSGITGVVITSYSIHYTKLYEVSCFDNNSLICHWQIS